jgi:hypothetical protein
MSIRLDQNTQCCVCRNSLENTAIARIHDPLTACYAHEDCIKVYMRTHTGTTCPDPQCNQLLSRIQFYQADSLGWYTEQTEDVQTEPELDPRQCCRISFSRQCCRINCVFYSSIVSCMSFLFGLGAYGRYLVLLVDSDRSNTTKIS